MRVAINLASQPYEVASEYKRRMTMVIAALGALAVLLAGYIVYQRVRSRGIDRQLATLQQEMNTLDREEAQARAILNKPANRVIADQSAFLNDLFARKSLSWTRIFSEMERIVPPGLHVVSMKPEYAAKSNDLVLRIVVATDSRDRAVELVRHMEKSSHFRQPQVVAETVLGNTGAQSAGTGNIQFDIAAIYVATGPDSGETAQSPPETSPAAQAPKPLGTHASPKLSAAKSVPAAPPATRGH